MKRYRRRKCLHCHDLFRPDPCNLRHQRYCSKLTRKRKKGTDLFNCECLKINLSPFSNNHRTRRKPDAQTERPQTKPQGPNLVEMAYQQYHGIAERQADPTHPSQVMPINNEESSDV